MTLVRLICQKCAGNPTKRLDTFIDWSKLKRKRRKSVQTNLTDMGHKPDGYFSGTREKMLKYVPEGIKTTLEFGCGFGGFSALLKRDFGVEAWAVEIDKAAKFPIRQHPAQPLRRSNMLNLVPL